MSKCLWRNSQLWLHSGTAGQKLDEVFSLGPLFRSAGGELDSHSIRRMHHSYQPLRLQFDSFRAQCQQYPSVFGKWGSSLDVACTQAEIGEPAIRDGFRLLCRSFFGVLANPAQKRAAQAFRRVGEANSAFSIRIRPRDLAYKFEL